MTHYAIFGGCFRSEIPFPELEPTSARVPDWTLTRAGAPPTAAVLEVLGQPGNALCRVTLSRTTAGLRLHHACTGIYDMLPDGTISFWRTASDDPESVQNDVIGRVMPVVMEVGGALCLHGSSVQVGDVAVAFLADSGTGKSTLATALLRAGGRLVSDDAVVVDLDERPTVRQGVHQIRLCSDAADRVMTPSGCATRSVDGKHVVRAFDQDGLMYGAAPLDAIYLLQPFHGSAADPAVRRVRLDTVPAAMGLVRNAKVGVLLDGGEARATMERALALAARLPVYRLEVLRDLARVHEAADTIVGWHAGGHVLAGAVRG